MDSLDIDAEGGSTAIMMDSAQSSNPSIPAAGLDLEISPAPTTRDEPETSTKKAKDVQRLVFIRPSAEYRYNADRRRMLRNSMLFGVGFLECANAGDFAANVWNEVPAPIYAYVLMGIGGAVALYISTFAFKDARLSWGNIQLLQDERNHLRKRKTDRIQQQMLAQDLDTRLDVNFRETGAEWVDRFGMDLIMGFGAVVVGIGTLMAIGGKNHTVWKASNLLSGYIGNAPAALWGLFNVAWCMFVFLRAHKHDRAAARVFEKKDPVREMLQHRARVVKYHAALYGASGFIGGIASLISATMWWGYILLAPCLAVTIYSNIVFRRKICYDRISIQELPLVNRTNLIKQLRGILSVRTILVGAGSPSLTELNAKPLTFPSALEFILGHGLFEDFCVRVINDPGLVSVLFGNSSDVLVMDSSVLQTASGVTEGRLLQIAMVCIGDVGVSFITRDNATFLLDTLGCTLCVMHQPNNSGSASQPKDDIEMV